MFFYVCFFISIYMFLFTLSIDLFIGKTCNICVKNVLYRIRLQKHDLRVSMSIEQHE